VQRRPDAPASAEEIRDRLTRLCQARLLREGFLITPLVDVVVLDPPEEVAGSSDDGT
jgi:hypothetical protein